MNKTYRLIWNHRLNAWIVASELTRASGKKASGRTRAGVAAVVLALGASLPLAAADLAPGALPTGGTVAAGQAAIAASGTRMDITQSSQKAIINWQGFDIGSQAQVNFAQPNASAVALNRVSGPTATRIEGQLTANGQVFLINPNGVLFGNGARVNAGAFVASTLNIGDDDFLAGKYTFTGTGGAIENQGAITAAPGGYLAFIAPKITNAGTLSAPQGTVAMGAGERVTLNFAGDRLVGLSVAAETLDTLIENRQAIRAEGGAILLTAAGAEAVTRSVINNSGVLEAGSLTADGGRIVLTAGNDINLGAGSSVAVDGKKGGEIRVQAQSGTLFADGNLSARGASGSGGGVQLLGRQVGLVNAAQVDVSGATGGGSVLVGGDYQGGNAEVTNARATYVAPDVTIKANALQQGDGGKVIVWANEIARFYGTISADGAGTGGNGGFVETSGKAVLDASGNVSALGAGGGRAGSWLLDPYDITIQTAGSNTNVTASPNFTSNGNSAIVTTGSIQTALNAGTSVTVTTGAGGAQAGNITVANAIAKSAGGNASLTFNATNNIVFNTGANVTSTVGALGLTVNAGGAITTLRGVSLNGGTLTLNAAGAVTQSSAITGNTTVVKNGAGTFTLSQNNTYTGATNINAGTLALGAANRIADTSAVTVASGATFNLANFAETVGSLAGAGNVTLGSATLTAGGNNTSTIFSGVASGTGGLTKAGTGTLTLSGANTYTGATTINAGTLTATGGSAIADNSQVTLANAAGATLNLTNNETIGNLSGGGATGGNVALGANTLTVNEAGATTYSGVVSGTGGLTKAGAGTLTLGGINTYTGATSINAGTLALNATGTIAASFGVANAGNFSIAAAKTIDSMTGAGTTALGANTLTIGDASNTSSTYTGVISGTGGLVKAGVGTLTLGGANTYTGTTTISAGTLRYGAGNAIAGGAVVVNNGGTYDLNNFSDTIGALTVNSGTTGGTVTTGAGTLTLGGNVTSTGGAANATISGNLALGGNRTFTTTNAADGLTVSAVISGANTLTKAGNGTLTLSGVNTYTGTTTISTGTLVAASNSALGSTTAGTTVANNANLTLQGGITVGAEALSLTGTGVGNNGALRNLSGNNSWGGTVTLAGTTEIQSDAGTLTLSAANSVTGTNRALTIDGAGNTAIKGTITTGTGTLTKNGTGTLTLSGANTYSGTTTINAGTLRYGANNAIAGGAVAVNNGGTYDLNNFSDTIGALTVNSGTTGGTVTTGAGTLTLGGNVTSTGGAANATISGNLALGGNRTFTTTNAADGLTVSAVISGANTLTKAGAGTLTLSGANTYTGTTTISAGTLVAGNASALGGTGSGTSVANGAALTVDNVALNAEPVTLQAGGTLRGNGNASLSGTVTQTGAATLGGTAGSTLTLNGTVNAGGFATAISGPGSVAAANAGNNFSTINIAGANNVSLRDANAITLGGGASTLTGNLVVQATGNITVTNTVTTTGGDITLAGANFVNSVGASALSASGRWLVYASTVTGNTFGGLLSGNQAIWGTSYPAAVSQLGNRYVFANSPTLTVTSVDRSKTYGQDGAPIVAGAFTVMGFVNAATYGNVFTQDTQANTVTGNAISAGSLTTANVGSYLIDVTPVTATTGYTLAKFNTGNLTVNPAPLTITGNSTTSQYTANAQANGYTVSGLLTGNGDSVTGVSTLASRTNVGTTNDNLTSATGTGLSNYTIGYVNGSLTITPAPLTITGNTTSSVYTAAAQTNGFTTAGLLGSDSVTSVATLASGTSVGTYADNLTSATGTGLSNYTIGYVNGGLTITPAPLTIKADNASRPVNTPNPPFTATYSGFVGGETPADVWGALQFSTPATVASPAGDYPITPFGQSSANYRITYVDGRLQVVGQPVTPPIIPPVPPLVTGERFDPQAVAATYMDAVPMVGQVPAVLYVSEQEGRSLLPDAASIRVVGGGLNVSR